MGSVVSDTSHHPAATVVTAASELGGLGTHGFHISCSQSDTPPDTAAGPSGVPFTEAFTPSGTRAYSLSLACESEPGESGWGRLLTHWENLVEPGPAGPGIAAAVTGGLLLHPPLSSLLFCHNLRETGTTVPKMTERECGGCSLLVTAVKCWVFLPVCGAVKQCACEPEGGVCQPLGPFSVAVAAGVVAGGEEFTAQQAVCAANSPRSEPGQQAVVRPSLARSLTPSFRVGVRTPNPGMQLDFGPLKEPIGFIKILEWIFAIFGFATCGGFSGKTALNVKCKDANDTQLFTANFQYPFRLNTVSIIPKNTCNQTTAFYLMGDFSSSAEFFVAIAVLAFIYCTAALVLYIGYLHIYRDGSRGPMI
ncbi:uncharacterized protein LOC109923715, partial [Rhincodon typus]|uniref:uncharacterized protein LOC109923715 n=1 Tax=Rhincodon typus TaxID=259920 RepID=UPI00202E5188